MFGEVPPIPTAIKRVAPIKVKQHEALFGLNADMPYVESSRKVTSVLLLNGKLYRATFRVTHGEQRTERLVCLFRAHKPSLNSLSVSYELNCVDSTLPISSALRS